MRAAIVGSIAALGLLACANEEILTDPSITAKHQAASGAGYTLTDLGTLGGTFALATQINNRGDIVGDEHHHGQRCHPRLPPAE